MSENFKAIKKKYFITAIIVSIALGVCCAVAVTCALAVAFKRLEINFAIPLYIPVALGVAALFSGLFFLILRPTDKRIAKKLDKDFALNQKVQTMVEYAGVSDTMAQLQREQTDDALEEVRGRRGDMKWLLKFAFIPVLAIAMLFTGIFVPARRTVEPAPEPPPPFDITEGQKTALENLIKDVRASSLDDGVKEPVIEVLNGLLDGLSETVQQSVMRAAVISAVKMIDTVIANSNSFIKISTALKGNEELATFAQAITEGALYYKQGGTQLTTFAAVTAKENEAGVEINAVFEKWTENYLKTLGDGTEEANPLPVEEAYNKVYAFASATYVQIAVSGYAPAEGQEATDALYLALASVYNDLTGINRSGLSPAAYLSNVKAELNRTGSRVTAALGGQSYGCMMDEYIRNSLSRIFAISLADFGSNEDVVPQNPNGNEPDGSHDPSTPPGEVVIGGEGLVLDVDTGELVPYGTLLEKYNNLVEGYIRSGACTEEIAIYIRQYFSVLYGGLDDED